jgi:hypothetical protein
MQTGYLRYYHNTLGGLSDEGLVSRTFYTTFQGTAQQLTLFESGAEYNLE